MSNPILQSNQSSAVVATVNESQTMSPWIYNETNRLVVPHALQILPINHSSGTVGASKTISFDIAKNGLVQGLWLEVSLKAETAATEVDNPEINTVNTGVDSANGQVTNSTGYTAMGLLQLIQEVRLTTSGRIVESLDKYQILARIADLPYGPRESVLRAYRCNGDPDHGGASDKWTACLWLPFFFAKDPSRYHLNSNFQEPFQVQVTFSACDNVLSGGSSGFEAASAAEPQDCNLLVHYRQLDEKSINEVVSKNFGDGLLSQIVHISKKEATKQYSVVGTVAAADRKFSKAQTIEVELKENDAIHAMYVIVETDTVASAYASALDNQAPVEILDVELKFNNTSVIKCSGEFLKAFGRWGLHGMCGDNTDSLARNSPTQYVYKIDFGLDMKKGAFSNVVALREISNPKLVLKYAPHKEDKAKDTSDAKYRCHVIYETATFLSTSSATGRVNLSISS